MSSFSGFSFSFFLLVLVCLLTDVCWSSDLNVDDPALNCTAVLPDGMRVNLSSMTTQDWMGNDTRIVNGTKGGFDYYVRLCGNVTNKNCTTNAKAGMVCQIDQLCELCGFEIAGPGNETPITWTYLNGRDIAGGLLGVPKPNGDACPAFNLTHRIAHFNLMCGPVQSPPIPSVVETNCTYTFTMYSCDACRNPGTCSNDLASESEATIDQYVSHRNRRDNAKKSAKHFWN